MMRIFDRLRDRLVAKSAPKRFRDGHFYSPVVGHADMALHAKRPKDLPAIDLNRAGQEELLRVLLDYGFKPQRYSSEQAPFGNVDALILSGILQHFRPGRVIEIGSGYSTAVMLDVADQGQLDVEITCIEPDIRRLQTLLQPGDEKRLTMIERPVQHVDPTIVDTLTAHDVLFIDSSHVAKAGSDVCYEIFYLLPRLPIGALVHVHDIFHDFDYPESWVREGRSWNEGYLIHAFLMFNASWEVLIFNNWLAHKTRLLDALVEPHSACSLWIRRTG